MNAAAERFENEHDDLPRAAGKADEKARHDAAALISMQDFRAYMPDHRYIFEATGELWPGSSVNSRLPPVRVGIDDKGKDVFISAAQWLDQNRAVEQMTWAPGEQRVIRDRIVSDGGWIERQGCSCFNLYRPPVVAAGDPDGAQPWIDHLRRVYPDEAEHITRWLAHRVQRPGEKINHALALIGGQGIGKDTLLEGAKAAVGPWNWAEVSPAHLLGRFNPFVKSVVLRVNEARDLGDIDRYAFYDHMKVYTAAPPDVLRCDEKNIREHAVMNVMGVIITSNHKADGIYLPADDRRHFVACSTLTKEDFAPAYFQEIYRWYAADGIENVAAYLAKIDLSTFDPKAPPPKTPSFYDIVDANRAPEDSELADAIERLGNPEALTLARLASDLTVDSEFRAWLTDRRNRRQIPHRLESAGYTPCRNPGADDGLWKVDGKRQAIYTQRTLTVRDALAKAQAMAAGRVP